MYYYNRSKAHKLVLSIASWLALAIFGVALALMVLLIRQPNIIFTYVHWMIVVAIGVATLVISIVLAVAWVNMYSGFEWAASCALIGVCTFVLMVLGICFAHEHVYEISKPEELNILTNLPSSEDDVYRIEITEDLDFRNVKPSDYYGHYDAVYIINGNGHSIKNLEYEAVLTNTLEFFRMGSNYDPSKTPSTVCSRVIDINLEDCDFYLTPNAYDESEKVGLTCDFNIFTVRAEFDSVNVVLDDVDINRTTVYIRPAEDNTRYITKSTVGEIRPANTSYGDSKISITIKRG